MRLKGSMRSGGNTHALELMRATENTFEDFGGHAAAGGFTVLDDAVFFLEDRLVEAHARLNTKEDDALANHADAVITVEEATSAFLKKIEKLAPYGMENPKPVFLLREISVRDISRFGKNEEHLKIKLSSSDDARTTIDAVAFFAKGALARTAESLGKGSRANVLAHLERDTFAYGNPVRLRLLNIRAA